MRLRIFLFIFLALCFAPGVSAQTVIQVPYGTAHFYWDAPIDPPTSESGSTRWYLLNCGGADIRIDAPATSFPVKTAVTAPGSYACTLRAANEFGVSEAAAFPLFEAGYVPPVVANPRIEVR